MKKNKINIRYFDNEEETQDFICIDFYDNPKHNKHKWNKKKYYIIGVIRIPKKGVAVHYCNVCRQIISVYFDKKEFSWNIHTARMWMEDEERLNRLISIGKETDWDENYLGIEVEI